MIPPHKNAQPAPFWAPKLDPKWSTSPPSPLSSRPPPPPRKGDGREFQNKAPKPPNPAVTPTCSGGRGPGAGMRHASGRLRASGPLNPGAKPVARGGSDGLFSGGQLLLLFSSFFFSPSPSPSSLCVSPLWRGRRRRRRTAPLGPVSPFVRRRQQPSNANDEVGSSNMDCGKNKDDERSQLCIL